jgi:hypothetical protein
MTMTSVVFGIAMPGTPELPAGRVCVPDGDCAPACEIELVPPREALP